MKKSNVAVILASILIISVFFSPASVFAAYTQQPAAWAREAAVNSLFHEIAYSEFMSEYDRPVTRAEFAMIAVNVYRIASGRETGKPVQYTFTDISDSKYKEEIQTAKNLGIVKGTNEAQTLYSPSNLVTRQEICVMIYRILQIIDPDYNYADIKENAFYDRNIIAGWAIKEVDFAYNEGIMQGTSAVRLQISPLDNTTREQALTLVFRMMNNWMYITPVAPRLLEELNLYQKAISIGSRDYLEDYLRDSLMNRKRDIRIVLAGSITRTDIESKLEMITGEFKAIGQYYTPVVSQYVIQLLSPIWVISVTYTDPEREFPESLIKPLNSWEEFDHWFLLQVRSGIAEASYDISDTAMRNSELIMNRIGRLLYLNPELNYVRKYTTVFNGSSSVRYTVRLEFEYTPAVTADRLTQTRDFAGNLLNTYVSPGMTAYEKELAIHDYIVSTTGYKSIENTSGDVFYEYSLFFSREAVCQAYASAVKLLLNMSGIYAIGINGTTNGIGHAWNIVKLYGDYYHLDATWNDPVPDNPGAVRYDYFNLSQSDILKTHVIGSYAEYPAAAGTRYNYFVYNNLLMSSKEEVLNLIKDRIRNMISPFTFRISDYSPAAYDISGLIRQAYSELGIGSYSYSFSVNSAMGVINITLN